MIKALRPVCAALLLIAPLLFAASPTTQPLPDPVDDIVFGEAMRARGLGHWLELDQADNPPADEAAKMFRQRERLLVEATEASGAPRVAVIRNASQILLDLIERYPSHPSRYRWQLELARDYLERQAPEAFEDLLLYELPGRDRTAVADLSHRAVTLLTALHEDIGRAWQAVEGLDEGVLAGLRESGWLVMLEQIDAQARGLLTWAKLHGALASDLDEEQRKLAFSQVLQELNDSGRLSPIPGREGEQAGALLLAAIAERKLGLCEQADSRARQMVSVLGRIGDKGTRQRLRASSLIAVLEQIRSLRDAGRLDAAFQSAAQAREWALKNRPAEPAALIAVCLLETGIVYRQQAAPQGQQYAASPSSVEIAAWLKSDPCVAVLEKASRQSTVHRDLLYRVLASALNTVNVEPGLTAHAIELLSGAKIADARENVDRRAGLDPIIQAIRATLNAPGTAADVKTSVELRHLLGQALDLSGADLEAVQFLTDLAEQVPDSDRAEAALRQAVTLASDELRRAGPSGSPASRTSFVRAARLLRTRNTADPALPDLTYAIGAALENDGRFEEAAGEYAAIPASHRCAQDAVLGRIRSWRRALEEASVRGSFDEADRAALAERARNAVASIREQLSATCTSRPASRPSDCAGMSTLLAFAELLNHPAIGGAEQTASLIAESEAAFRSCPELLGPALRQKIVALRQLKRLTEARAVVDQYLAADPEHAGSVMAGLLQSMHDEVSNLLELGDLSSAAMVAGEAVQVGQSLLTWGDAKPERLRSSDRLVIRLWHASALLRAGESATALHAFEEIERQAQSSLPENSATRILLQLGKADALLAVGRHTDALAAYASIWQACPEHSPEWWHAFVGNLRCHARLDAVPDQVLASIKQQRFLSPELGGKRWQRELLQIEQESSARAASQPQR